MNEEIDDSEFYHQDFTTASEWEIFTARIEEIINQWKTDDLKNELLVNTQHIWDIRSERLTFCREFQFKLYFCRKKIDGPDLSESSEENEKQNKNPINGVYDFELYDENASEPLSCLSTWYGLNEFIVLGLLSNDGVTCESQLKLLLSSVYIAASNLNCEVPIFLQIWRKEHNCYLGVYEGEGIRTNFEMVYLKQGPSHCHYLTGLLDLFKTKIMSPCTIDNIMVSVQFSYTLTDFGNFIWKQDILCKDNFDVETIFLLPLGVTVDAVSAIVLKATWNHLSDNLVVDSENYSDFDPMVAPKWSCLTKVVDKPHCLLGDCLNEFLEHQGCINTTAYDLLGDFIACLAPESNPLDLLTEPTVPTISTLLNRAARNSLTKNKTGNPPISDSVLVPLLYYLFPDADEKSNFPYGVKENKVLADRSSDENVVTKNLEEEFKGFKTCGVDSLTWRLSIVLAHSLQSLGGREAFVHIWYEFVQEMRYRWENSMPIPGLSPGFPDLRTCLLNQKLQMLNCCIDRKLSRENMYQSSHYDSAEDSSTDDEFFDCSEKPDEETKRKQKHSLWNQPVGRLSKFGDLKLLNSGDPLYIPVTQEPVLKTEDQLEEDTDVLLKLGSNAEASELRARIMSASLLSDMESFKAANPGSVVEDFIRWYSPRDWIEEEELDEWGQKKGHLSPRMLIEENNIWVQMWESARPVPASRQKRLFDDTREAEKILQFLDYRTVSQMCELVLPILTHAAIYRLVEECQLVLPELSPITVRINSLLKHGERISRDLKFDYLRYEDFIKEVTALELLTSQAYSLHYKFNPLGIQDNGISNIVSTLVLGKEVEIENKSNSDVGKRIVAMFSDAQKVANITLKKQIAVKNRQKNSQKNRQKDSVDQTASGLINTVFPPPSEKEFVLRVNAVKPACYSAKCPQFLKAILNKNEFRLAGAFSEDLVFF